MEEPIEEPRLRAVNSTGNTVRLSTTNQPVKITRVLRQQSPSSARLIDSVKADA
jgi:hypothetical protein